MKRHKLLKVLIILGIIALVWVGCGDKDTEPQENVQETEVIQEEEPEEEQPDVQEEKPEEEPQEEPLEALDPDFKAMMDSYEAFFDEYVEFMNTYNDSDDTLGMLADYTEYMTKFTDYMGKLEQVESEDLNAAETAYYLEVNSRVMKKLATVAE